MIPPQAPAGDVDLREALDEGLASLPQRYRTPLVLCCWEGKSNEEAAEALACPVGTVKSRLARGRDLLRQRLLRRGVAVPAAALSAALSGPLAAGPVPPALLGSTVAGAMSAAGGTAAASAPALLAQAVLRGLWLARVKLGLGLLLCGTLVCLGMALALGAFGSAPPGAEPPAVPPAVKPRTEGALPVAAQAEVIKGIIKEVRKRAKNLSILVERAPRDAIVFHLRADTRITYADQKKATAADLKVGLRVRVQTSGEYANSDPPQATADAIVIEVRADGKKPQADASGDRPLPKGAVGRLGTTRFRPGGMVSWLNLSRDGKRLITNGGANGLFVWDVATRELILRLSRFATLVAEISHDGSRLLVSEIVSGNKPWLAENNTVLKIYQLSSGKVLQTITSRKAIANFALAPDDRTVALELVAEGEKHQDGAPVWKSELELRDLPSGRVLRTFGRQEILGPTNRLRFSPDGKSLFAISALATRRGDKSTARRFDTATGELKVEMAIDGLHYLEPFTWDGKKLVAAGNKIWDLEKGRLHWASKGDLGGIYGFMPDGETVLGVPGKGKVLGGQLPSHLVLWDLETDRELRRFPNRGEAAFVVMPDGKSCITGGTLYSLVRWDTANGKEIQPLNSPMQPPQQLVFSPDGKYAATVDYQTLHVWDRTTGKRIHHLPRLNNPGLLRFLSDGRTLLFPGSTRIHTLDLKTWKEGKADLEGLEFTPGGPNYAELSPDGKVLAASALGWGSPQAIRLWDWSSGKRIGQLGGDDRTVERLGPLAFSPDGKRLACLVYPQNHIQVWNVADRKLVAQWKVQQDLTALQFIEDGEFLVGGFTPRGRQPGAPEVRDADPAHGYVCVWNPTSGKELSRFRYPRGEYTGLRAFFSPDGKVVATANQHENLVRFWDLATGKELGEFRGHIGGITTMTFSPDGAVLGVCGDDTTVLLVDVRKLVGKR
jgi:WD40 repeat protein